jgi:two-component system, LuxR family, response regulator FixJ
MTVHVIDDDQAMRDSLDFLLGVQGFSVALYGSAAEFLAALPRLPARDCILSDISMPGMTGIELVRQLKARGAKLPVILMTGHADVPMAVEAMKAGVSDFIEKPFAQDVLLDALNTALSRDASGDDDQAQAAKERLANLSPRETDVLKGVVAGKANKIIAYELGISARTVEIYRANLMSKTGTRNLSELMRVALAAGL